MSATLRENLIATMAMYAGEMDAHQHIHIPCGVAGEDSLADFCVKCVNDYLNKNIDIPFDEYATTCLQQQFGCCEEDYDDFPSEVENEYETNEEEWEKLRGKKTHRVIAVAGTVEKELGIEGSYEFCEWWCDDMGWCWNPQGDEDGFQWDLYVEEM